MELRADEHVAGGRAPWRPSWRGVAPTGATAAAGCSGPAPQRLPGTTSATTITAAAGSLFYPFFFLWCAVEGRAEERKREDDENGNVV